MEYRIDCAEIDSRAELHRAIAKELSFPAWYGNNLDALYDCLTGICAETHLTLINWDSSASYARGFHRVLTQAETDNPLFHVTFQ